MRYRAFASLLAISTVAALASTAAHAEPLSIDACEDLKTELAQLESGGITRALDEGPEWATKNLSGEQLDLAKRYVHIDEVVRFRCPEREQLEKGEIPPLPVVAPNRAKKIKEIEALAKVAAEEQAEAQKGAEADAAKQETARQAEAEKRKEEANEAGAAQVSGSPPFAAADDGMGPGGKAASVDKAAASLAPGAEESGGSEPVLKTRLDGNPPGDSPEGKASPKRQPPLSADGIAPGEKGDPSVRKPPRLQRGSRAEPVQAVPVDAEQLRQAEAAKRAGAEENSWFSFFRRSFP